MKRFIFVLFLLVSTICWAEVTEDINPRTVPADTVHVDWTYVCPGCGDTIHNDMLYSAKKDMYYQKHMCGGRVTYDSGLPEPEKCDWCKKKVVGDVMTWIFIGAVCLFVGFFVVCLIIGIICDIDESTGFSDWCKETFKKIKWTIQKRFL